MIIKVDKNGILPIAYFENYLDISAVVFYTLQIVNNSNLKIKFYDKNMKLMKLNKEHKSGKKEKKFKRN